MKLTKFRVTNFRSVADSGWVDADDVTALIGVNESGKTNLLLPLWKLKPAQDGEIQPTSDYPKTMFGEIRNAPGDYHFVEAEFETGDTGAAVARIAGVTPEEAETVRVSRFFDGHYSVEFPKHSRPTTVARVWLAGKLTTCADAVEAAQTLKKEGELQPQIVTGLKSTANELSDTVDLNAMQLRSAIQAVDALIPEEPADTSVIVPMVRQLSAELSEQHTLTTTPPPGRVEGVVDAVVAALPPFVYYSNYGNLDSEIYLPHVVQNLAREDLGAKESAKARTLRVLFSFVQLEAQEILELGRDFKEANGQNREPTADEIAQIAEQKRTRSILLQSAGATLTTRFRDWWKQGDYRFRFEADGNHFRIWVADDRRPTEVELENRSTGLQWFLSFYLVFLVESRGDHSKAILLLDEPGVSLHPLAQRDLSAFFESLSDTNQIIYTSHSPFLVDADRLEQARKVYVAADGTTKATPNLRHNEGRDEQAGAAYAVHSALNLSVAESLLVGCRPVLVEGPSDQHYLTAMKALLVSGGKITPKRELVFPPSGGTKTARVVASILTGRDEVLPMMLLDDDGPGRQMRANLAQGLYAEAPDKVLSVGMFVDYDRAEIEDLMPFDILADEIDRMEREPELRFADVVQAGQPFVGQLEAWADAQGVTLDEHWKVTLSIKVKQRVLTRGVGAIPVDVVERWVRLFEAFSPNDVD
ncbi:AAA ATPase domain-containing protein [Monaibacterium marinum]|uniref:AAA ATPase domain-containing protein n=1 Tax=Pontivivens marinum TaxID=1690039 RepID=A0A2C9CVJ5_9RHOB|nr:AAA family ATPase [Monaibacterium marinum]SOH95233.1 AAA ATPase domain-containing protein [Monaibacterium marinum]